MVHAAHLHGDVDAGLLQQGHMLFRSRIHAAGNDLLHLFATAHDGHALVLYIGDDVTAMGALKEFHKYYSFILYFPLRIRGLG